MVENAKTYLAMGGAAKKAALRLSIAAMIQASTGRLSKWNALKAGRLRQLISCSTGGYQSKTQRGRNPSESAPASCNGRVVIADAGVVSSLSEVGERI